MYEMKEEYKIGVPMIDEEHKHLFDLAEEAYQLLNEEFLSDKYDEIAAIIQELKEYTKKHFSDEEEYMESIDYQAIFIQKAQHRNFIAKLEETDMETIDLNQNAVIKELLEFLTDWLINHIMKMDMHIGK